MSIESVMPSNHLILCHPLLLPPSIFPSITIFSNQSVHCFRWPKYWSFSFSISPSSEYSGLISFRIDWLDLLAAQGTSPPGSSVRFPREGYWSGLPFPPLGESSRQRDLLHCGGLFTTEPPVKSSQPVPPTLPLETAGASVCTGWLL